MTLDPITARRLDTLALPPGPLFVVDVDDVVLRFLEPFRALLAERDLLLVADSFRLDGNVRDRAGTPATKAVISETIDTLFAEQDKRQVPLEGAVEGLRTLASHGPVVLLTAMRHGHFEVRQRTLAAHGIDVPLVTTEGSKGRAIASLARTGPVVFIDDLPHNHADVSAHVPRATTIQLVTDAEFGALMPPLPAGTLRADSWDEVVDLATVAIAGMADAR